MKRALAVLLLISCGAPVPLEPLELDGPLPVKGSIYIPHRGCDNGNPACPAEGCWCYPPGYDAGTPPPVDAGVPMYPV